MSTIVLYSGGLDSTAAALWREIASPTLVFADYKQSYRTSELAACLYMEARGGAHVVQLKLDALERTSMIVHNRNETILVAALRKYPDTHEVVLGVRNPFKALDEYGDSNGAWLREMSEKYGRKIWSPVLGWPKWLVKAYIRYKGLDPQRLFCSEGIAP